MAAWFGAKLAAGAPLFEAGLKAANGPEKRFLFAGYISQAHPS